MQKARQSLLQIGSIILCVNGALWFMSNLRQDGPATFGQLLFRLGVFLLGMTLVGTAGLLALIEKFQGPSASEPQVIEESDLIDADVEVAEQKEVAERETE